MFTKLLFHLKSSAYTLVSILWNIVVMKKKKKKNGGRGTKPAYNFTVINLLLALVIIALSVINKLFLNFLKARTHQILFSLTTISFQKREESLEALF